MSKTKVLFLLVNMVLPMVLVAGCGDDDSSIASICEKGCAVGAGLKCPNDKAATCAADCQKEVEDLVATKPACESKLKLALSCGANRPLTDWECDADGESNVKENVCKEEFTAAFACFGGK